MIPMNTEQKMIYIRGLGAIVINGNYSQSDFLTRCDTLLVGSSQDAQITLFSQILQLTKIGKHETACALADALITKYPFAKKAITIEKCKVLKINALYSDALTIINALIAELGMDKDLAISKIDILTNDVENDHTQDLLSLYEFINIV